MAKAQLPTSEATSLQVSEELDTQRPLKISRLHEEKEKRDSSISLNSKLSRREPVRQNPKQQIISQQH